MKSKIGSSEIRKSYFWLSGWTDFLFIPNKPFTSVFILLKIFHEYGNGNRFNAPYSVRAPSLPHQFEYHTERNLGPKSLGIFIFLKNLIEIMITLTIKSLNRLGELLTKQTNSFGRTNSDYPELILGQRNHECKFFFCYIYLLIYSKTEFWVNIKCVKRSDSEWC